MAEIYSSAEDSYFFAKFLEKYLSKNKISSYLDMGVGSAILSESVSKFLDKKNIFVADINPLAVKLAKKKGFNAIKTNLFENIKGKFDLITFNAPYLPEDIREPKSSRLATTGGKLGDEISLKFLRRVKKYLNKDGKVFLLISSLTPLDKIKKFEYKIVARKKLFMEELLILEFCLLSPIIC
ncbi:MAG: HemK2/MTQ2 family protein methyltransferase [Nanoarchaeota archaeon]|nr:HemK2/MTQ2 family protein methyltransferase [Nanoarchaeota archaeon]